MAFQDCKASLLFPSHQAISSGQLQPQWGICWRAILPLALGFALIPIPAWALAKVTLHNEPLPIYPIEESVTLWGGTTKSLDEPGRQPALRSYGFSLSGSEWISPGNRFRSRGKGVRPQPQVKRLSPKVKQQPRKQPKAFPPMDPSVSSSQVHRYSLLAPEVNPKTVGGSLIGGTKERMMYSTGDRVFLKLENAEGQKAISWYAFRHPKPIRDPETQQLLGYLLLHTGRLRLESRIHNGLYTAIVEQAYAPIENGNRIYPREKAESRTWFVPKPAPSVQGRILQHIGSKSLIGEGQIAALDLGTDKGLKRGHILIIRERPRQVSGPNKGLATHIQGRKKGKLMIVRTNKRMSFGLIIRNQLPVEPGDQVVGPEN